MVFQGDNTERWLRGGKRAVNALCLATISESWPFRCGCFLSLGSEGGDDLAGGLAEDGLVEPDLEFAVFDGEDADVSFGHSLRQACGAFGEICT